MLKARAVPWNHLKTSRLKIRGNEYANKGAILAGGIMNILIRQMKPEEAAEVTKIGKKAFGFLEGFFLTKQKEAIVAVDGDNLLGGVYYSTGKQACCVNFS